MAVDYINSRRPTPPSPSCCRTTYPQSARGEVSLTSLLFLDANSVEAILQDIEGQEGLAEETLTWALEVFDQPQPRTESTGTVSSQEETRQWISEANGSSPTDSAERQYTELVSRSEAQRWQREPMWNPDSAETNSVGHVLEACHGPRQTPGGDRSPDAHEGSRDGRRREPVNRINKRQRRCLKLWHWLLWLLENTSHSDVIRWEDKRQGVFVIEKPKEIAAMWSQAKNSRKVTTCYEHMARAMRYYYKAGIMTRVLGRRLVYRFCSGADMWKKSLEGVPVTLQGRCNDVY